MKMFFGSRRAMQSVVAAETAALAAWRGSIDEHLVSHLVYRASQQRRLRPWHLLPVVWVLATMTLTGPTWQRVPAPCTADQVALAMVVKMIPSMLAQAVQPPRLEWVVQKVHDLLVLRPGAKMALIAYAERAHMVLPRTSDASIIDPFAAALSPQIIPTAGEDNGHFVDLLRIVAGWSL